MELKIHWMADLLPMMSEKEFEDLKEDISGIGQLLPIIVFNGEILDGRHRYRACKEIGIEPWIEEFEGGMSLNDAVRSLNLFRRHLTASQRAMVAAELLKPYEEKSKQNQIESGEKTHSNQYKKVQVVEKFPQPALEPIDVTPKKPAPKATDMAAKDWGVSGRAVRDAKVIVEDGTIQEKEAVKKGKASVATIAKKIRESKKQEPEIKPPAPKKMNFTNDNIEWAKWSWNPVTGCLHGCPYCYARDIATRFDGGFEPKYHIDRLTAPQNTSISQKDIDVPGIKNVFVCSMADLFGNWVNAKWIQSVIDVCKKESQWKYLFLTKNPERYLEFAFPPNCLIGASADTQERANRALNVFEKLGNKNTRFLSCEPLMERVVLSSTERNGIPVGWVIIGGRSKSTGMPAGQPEWEWVESLLIESRKHEIAVYFKPNLTVRPKEMAKDII